MKAYSTSTELKVAVVGYGGAFNMGRQHLQQAQAAGMQPTAVVELDPQRLAAATEDFPGIETYAAVADMLHHSAANLVIIITPHNTHAELAMQCLRAGRHVVCEKPLAITTVEVDAMMEAAHNAGVVLSTYHNRHWDGCILDAVERVREQRWIGDIVRIECHMLGYRQPGDWWRSSRSISGGILYDWGVHLLEYSLQLLDAQLTEVSGFAHQGFWAPKTRWQADTLEDEAYAVARFATGQWLTLHFSSIDAKGKDKWVEITGTLGSYAFDGSTWEWRSVDTQGLTIKQGKNRDSNAGLCYYQNLVDHLVNGAELIITPEWSRRPIQILDLAVRSAREGRSLMA